MYFNRSIRNRLSQKKIDQKFIYDDGSDLGERNECCQI